MVAMDPGAVIPAFPHEWQHPGLRRVGGHRTFGHEMRPASAPAESRFHRAGPEIDGEALLIRLDHVLEAIAVEVDETQAVVVALGIEQRATGWQRKIRGLPVLILPQENLAIGQQFADAIMVEVAQACDESGRETVSEVLHQAPSRFPERSMRPA